MDSLLSILSSSALIYIFIIFIVVSYLLLALFNWNFIKPLKYIGISSIIVGILFTILRLLSGLVSNFIKDIFPLPDVVISSIFKPILIIGIVELVIGIALIVVYKVINKQKKPKDNKPKQTKKSK